jgi:hypothetical protein
MGTIFILCCICNTQYFYTKLKGTPGQLVFGIDMVLPINFMADWGEIEQQRQKEMAHNNRRENASRINPEILPGRGLNTEQLGNRE